MPALGGRFDQTIASINMLYFMKDEVERKVILLSDENITVLLDKVSKKGVWRMYHQSVCCLVSRVHITFNVYMISKDPRAE